MLLMPNEHRSPLALRWHGNDYYMHFHRVNAQDARQMYLRADRERKLEWEQLPARARCFLEEESDRNSS